MNLLRLSHRQIREVRGTRLTERDKTKQGGAGLRLLELFEHLFSTCPVRGSFERWQMQKKTLAEFQLCFF